MKLAIPTDTPAKDALVAPSFGRAACFALYETESGTWTFLDNSATAAAGGAGVKAAQTVVDSGSGAVAAFRCGENAAAVLSAAGIALYEAQDGTAADNVEKFEKNLLQRLAASSGMHHQGGHGQ